MAFRLFLSLFVIVLLPGARPAIADVPPSCAQVQQRFEDLRRRMERRRPINESTEQALAELQTSLLESRIDDPVGARNEILDRDPPVNTREQQLIVRRMVVVYCQIIFSQDTIEDDAKRDQMSRVASMVSTAEPFSPVETTLAERAARYLKPARPSANLMIPASYTRTSDRQMARGQRVRWSTADLPPAPGPSHQDLNQRVVFLTALDRHSDDAAGSSSGDDEWDEEPQFLAEAPYVVNDTNKYFVIVGSAGSRESGVRMMNKLKAASPHHDFALYPPYRGNPNYAIMIASWVSRDVAKTAQAEGLAVARKLLKDRFKAERDSPYMWCYPSGSCRL